MLLTIALAVVAMAVSLALQAVMVVSAVRRISAAPKPNAQHAPARIVFRLVGSAMVVLMTGTILQVTVWAVLYHLVAPLKSFETEMYFSGVTFSSLGYGDVVLPPGVRLLGPLEASTGLLMFGITTAVLVAILQFAVKDRRR
jgi:hypothetical protein